MSWVYIFIISLLTIDLIVAIGGFIGVRFVKPRWPEWWERNIAAPDPEDGILPFEQDEWVNKPDIRSELAVPTASSG